MVTGLDTRLVPRAKALLLKYGKDAVFTEFASRVYDPTSGDTTETTPTNYTWKITPPEGFQRQYVDGDVVQANDLKTYVAAEDIPFTPRLAMRVVFDAQSFDIVNVEPIYTGELIALYGLQLRQ